MAARTPASTNEVHINDNAIGFPQLMEQTIHECNVEINQEINEH